MPVVSKRFVTVCVLVGMTVVLAPAAEARSARTALPLVPRRTALVISVDVAALKGSTVFRRLLGRLSRQTALKPALEVLRRGAGIDIHSQVSALVVALAPDFERSKQVALFIDAKTDHKRLVAFAKRSDPRFKQLRWRGVTYYRIANEIEVAFLGRFTVLAGRGYMATIIDTRAGIAPSLASAPGFRAMITGAQRQRSLWAVFDLPRTVRAALAKHLGKHGVHSVMLSAGFASGLDLQLRIATGSAAETRTLAAKVRAWLTSTGSVARTMFGFPSLRSLKVSAGKRTIDVAGHLSPAQLAPFTRSLLNVL